MVRYVSSNVDANDDEMRPPTDDRDIAQLIPAAVAEVLAAAEPWLGWNGQPTWGEGNVWTPHKVIRRVADHLLDHLAEIECRLAGEPTIPDHWHGRMITTDADFARFTEVDLDETTSRLDRFAACYRARLTSVDPQKLDCRPNDNTWTLREVVHHVSGITGYADMLGNLSVGRLPASQ